MTNGPVQASETPMTHRRASGADETPVWNFIGSAVAGSLINITLASLLGRFGIDRLIAGIF